MSTKPRFREPQSKSGVEYLAQHPGWMSKPKRKQARDAAGPIRRYKPGKEDLCVLSDEYQSRPVPPDTERQSGFNNADRAKAVQVGLIAFANVTGQKMSAEPHDIVADFVCDLAHFCDRKGLQLSALMDRGMRHYSEETAGKGQQFKQTVEVPSFKATNELYDLLHADIYTDAPEYGERVDRIKELLKDARRNVLASPAQIEAARNLYQTDDVEVDDDAVISALEDEAGSVWVSAWVYVNGTEVVPVEPKEETQARQYRVHYWPRRQYTQYEIHLYPCQCGMHNSNSSFNEPITAMSVEDVSEAIRAMNAAAVIAYGACIQKGKGVQSGG